MGYNFIVMAPNNWFGQWMNRQQLFSRIGARHNVIYTNGAWFSWDTRTDAFQRAPLLSTFDVADNVKVFSASKLFVRIPRLAWLDKVVRRFFCSSLRSQMDPHQPVILYLFHPDYFDYQPYAEHQLLIYHAYDDFSKQGGYTQQTADKELALLKSADLVFASSESIKNRLLALCPDKAVQVVPNGVDFELFSAVQDEPADLAAIPHPRVGYTGSINKKVDLRLLHKLATALSEVNFVLIGGQGQLGEQKPLLEQLHQLANVHFLGARPLEILPAYVQHMDINTMLYRTDKGVWAASGYPLKLHEYLAAGKPIISAAIDAVIEFEGVVDLARNDQQWAATIKSMLATEDDQEKSANRQAVARQNTWNARVENILDEIKRKN